MKIAHDLSAFLVAFLFALGLALSGMTSPARVFGFLDVFGHWDPSLLFVMAGAVGVHSLLYRLVRRRERPFFSLQFDVPTRRDIDRRLVIGAALFGAGWGIGGYCPGPGLASIATLDRRPLLFVLFMLVGMVIAKWMPRRT